ncbi:MAG: hypothetical protein PHE43_00315 [Candidatus Nanoarchaeia archaeon]|nr:hypothetical protein [Candidatus Nanoarchaeia archaeon]
MAAKKKTTKRKTTRKVVKKPVRHVVKHRPKTEPVKMPEYVPIAKKENILLVTIGRILQILSFVALVLTFLSIWGWWAGLIIFILLMVVGSLIKRAGRR